MKEKDVPIQFHYQTAKFFFPLRNELKRFILGQLLKEGKRVDSINYIFCNDAYLLQINQQYLDHDTLTDIITFELSPKGQPLLSDIYISIERVRENAKTYHSSFTKELRRVLFHGALHLAGYKDKTKEQEKEIRLKEEEYLGAFAVSRRTVSSRNKM
ncbi:MAG: rRNA maturation RNase YbeY [Bacteroidota bacterium]|nr:rRNA maturation RNase YbeY [Bacteroidota bacterium]